MANLKIDAAKTDIQNMMELIKLGNPTAAAKLTEGSLTFAAPAVLAEVDAEGRNSSVVVTAAPEFEYYGSVTVKYRRLAIATETVLAPTMTFNIGMNQDIAALISEIETAWGLVPGEIEATLPDLTGGDQGQTFQMAVSAKADSLLYIGPDVTVTLTYQEPSLATLITVLDLPGFDPVSAP